MFLDLLGEGRGDNHDACCHNLWKKRRHMSCGNGALNQSRGGGRRDSHRYSRCGFWRKTQHMSSTPSCLDRSREGGKKSHTTDLVEVWKEEPRHVLSAIGFLRPTQRRRGGTVMSSSSRDFGRKKEDAGHGCVQVLVLEKEEAAHP